MPLGYTTPEVSLPLSAPPRKYDNTKRSTAATCLRKYYFEHVRGIKPLKGSTALRYGSVYHEVMDAFYSTILEHGWGAMSKAMEAAVVVGKASWEEYSAKQEFYEDYRTFPNLIKSFMYYLDRYSGDITDLQVLSSEEAFKVDMTPHLKYVEKAYKLYPFYFTGILDLKLKLNGQIWFADHKSTGQPLDQQAQRLRRAAQFMGYTFGLGERQETDVAGFLISFHHLSCYKRKDGTYSEPKIDFRRVPEIYSPGDVLQWLFSFCETVHRIQWAEEHNCWPMQFDSCYNYGACSYITVCEGVMPNEVFENPQFIPNGFYLDDPWDVEAESLRKKERRLRILNKGANNGQQAAAAKEAV